MRKLLYIIMYIPLLLLTACELDVHEWPERPVITRVHMKLGYETEMTEWFHRYDDVKTIEVGYGETYDNILDEGEMRYIVRAYPLNSKSQVSQYYAHEYVFTKDVKDGYDYEATLDMTAGRFRIMVWSDFVRDGSSYYNPDNFNEISLQGDYVANSDYRDAFRGTTDLTVVSDYVESDPDTFAVTMQRPLGKLELITTDVVEFIEKEFTRLVFGVDNGKNSLIEEDHTRVINIDDYKVVLYYSGFLPISYNMNTDRPIDSSTGIMYESSLKLLSETTASIGFDYVFVNGNKLSVAVQIGVYNDDGTELSLTEPIEISLKRNHHTKLTGKFLITETTGGIVIMPSFDGEHNIIVP